MTHEINRNRAAFLTMLGWSEGTIPLSDRNGYDVIVGGAKFKDFADHPRQSVWLPKYGVFSTAAGRYQLLARYWNHYRDLLRLPDFGPDSQDQVALQQIKEFGALSDIDAGRFEDAVQKVRTLWASLPAAGYGQHEQSMAYLLDRYTEAGGTTA